ncbi:hypothetical protein LEN26_011347 [Aphanomyces euteiches]|nr:hypothetical protein AeMF1_017948 [Aphanomyces euteiches]KAH9119945.1 hypothetical protein LEN26_011347 [Aphanomyces euteiches]KAH9189658.1 hypothetical protein AeNC1_008359 [Aphanomyces euteiches]
MSPAGGPAGGGAPPTPTAQGTTGRDSIGSIMHEFVDSFPIDMDSRQSISDLGKVLFTDAQKGQDKGTTAPTSSSSSTNAGKKPFQMPKEIKGIPRQKQQDVMGITASGRVALPQGSVRKLLQTQGKAIPMRWTPEEDDMLRQAVETHGERNWKSIAEVVPGRNHTQCLQRWTKVLAPGLIKGHWRPDEDDILRQLVAEGRKNWGQVAARIPGRTSKQCRERWYNHLDPNIVRGDYTPEEDQIIIEAQQRIGNRWSAIAAMLPGRTEDAVKIRWKSLCRTKSGRNRKAQAEKDEKQGYDMHGSMAVPNGAAPPYRINPQMNYPRHDDHTLPPFQHGHLAGPMHQHMHQQGIPSVPDYQQGDMYNPYNHHPQRSTSGFMAPSSSQPYNAASAFMQKMNQNFQPSHQQHQPQVPDYNQYYNGYSRSAPSNGYQPTSFPTPSGQQDPYHQPMKVEPANAGGPAASFAHSVGGGSNSAGPPTSFAPNGSPRHSLVTNFVQSLNGSNSPQRHSLATNFAQNLNTSRPPPVNLAANFAQSQATKPPTVIPVNVAASFAQRVSSSNEIGSMEGDGTDTNKRPRLPVNMDAARAAAARRMRQGDNHADFVSNPAELPVGEMPRISVSDINLSELGPIEEMWRVSSDMNRLSL